jgi:hypothetical protein
VGGREKEKGRKEKDKERRERGWEGYHSDLKLKILLPRLLSAEITGVSHHT